MIEINASTELDVPEKFWRVTLAPVKFSNPTVVGFVVICTMQLAAVNCPVAALV